MAEKTMYVKIANAQWIAEIHQQGPIVTPIELPIKIVSSLVRKNYKVTAVNKATKEEVKLTVLNAMDPFKVVEPKKEKGPKPINPNIGAPVQETVQPKKVEPVVEEPNPVEEMVAAGLITPAPVEEVVEVEEAVTEVTEAEEVIEEEIVEENEVVVEVKPHNNNNFNYNGKKNKNKNFTK